MTDRRSLLLKTVSIQRVSLRLLYKRRVDTRGSNQPLEHLPVHDMIIREAGITPRGSFAPVHSFRVVMDQPSEPVLLFRFVPHARLV